MFSSRTLLLSPSPYHPLSLSLCPSSLSVFPSSLSLFPSSSSFHSKLSFLSYGSYGDCSRGALPLFRSLALSSSMQAESLSKGEEEATMATATTTMTTTEKLFSMLELPPKLQARLYAIGLEEATAVQWNAIPVLLRGEDAAVQSFTGSGKTLSYIIPILSRVGPLRERSEGEPRNPNSGIEAVVVVPSRELGMQIVREFERVLGPDDRKAVQQLVGGANRLRQEEALKKNKPSVVVGTPGRIAEISRAGKLHTHNCRFLVLDEADGLLGANFRGDLLRIVEHVGRKRSTLPLKKESTVERQVVLVSATMPSQVLRAGHAWGHKPTLVKASSVEVSSTYSSSGKEDSDIFGAKTSLPPSLDHYYTVCQHQHRVDTLRKCINALNARSVIAFMNHPKRLKDAVFKLEARGVNAASLHGELGKLERTRTLANFRSGKLRVLVTNEVAARGLDIPECDLVVNLELPSDGTHYAHRAGRTARLGRPGLVLTLCERSEVFVIRKFRQQLEIPITPCDFVEGELVLLPDQDSKLNNETAPQIEAQRSLL